MHIHGIAIKPVKKGAMVPVEIGIVTKESGLEGDCRGGGGLTRRRQITVISLEQWQEACAELGQDLPWHTRRANLCVEGGRFGPEDVGKLIVILESDDNNVVLEITGETEPCRRMDQACQGLKAALKPNWRAGVTCRVVDAGTITVGHPVSITQP